MIQLFLKDPQNGSAITSLEQTIRENNLAIQEAFRDVISRVGGALSQPNFMLSDLDLNGNRLLNPGPGTGSENEFITRGEVSELQASIFRVNPDTNDLEFSNGGSFETLFTIDQLRGDPGEPGVDGISGSGTGDLISSLNLSDVSDVVAARSNLGLSIGTDIAAYNAELVGFDPATKADVEDLNNKADVDDFRFERYVVEVYTANQVVNVWGRLYRPETPNDTVLTIAAGEDGCVNSLYVPPFSGSVTLTPATGVTLLIAGEVIPRPIVITQGGQVSITAIDSTGTTFVVAGAGIQP